MKRSTALTALLLALCVAGEATAQDQPADASAQRTYELNEQGFQAFDEGRFAEAATYFGAAWELSRDDSLRKNESLAWFRAGRCEEAIDVGNKYLLSGAATDTDKADIHSVIANCKVEFARRATDANDFDLADNLLNEAEVLEADALTQDRIDTARVELAAARKENAIPPKPEIRTVYVNEPAPPVLEYSLLGAGGAVVAGAFVYQLVALGWQRKFLQMERGEIEGEAQTFDSLRKRVHFARAMLPVLYTAGLGTAAVGATMLFFVEPDEDGNSTAWLGVQGTF